jgi:hypothetical protein
MIEWSDTDLMVRDAVRQFVDKEIRPHLDELETGALSPYPIARRLFSQFGLDVLAAESVKKMLDRDAPSRMVRRRAKSRTAQTLREGWATRDRWSRCWFPKSPGSASDC